MQCGVCDQLVCMPVLQGSNGLIFYSMKYYKHCSSSVAVSSFGTGQAFAGEHYGSRNSLVRHFITCSVHSMSYL